MDTGGSSAPRPPIVLGCPEESLALGLLLSGFFGLALLLLGAVIGAWGLCAAGGAVLASGLARALYQRGSYIEFQAHGAAVHTPFSQTFHPYQGMNLLLRRSWTVTGRLWGVGGGGLAGVAIQLRRGSRAAVSVPVSWKSAKNFSAAMAFLEGLPLPKRYL